MQIETSNNVTSEIEVTPKLSRAQLEERRLEAGRLLQQGRLTRAEIARRLGVTRGAVTQWAQRLGQDEGLERLRGRKPPGPKSKLSEGQWCELIATLRGGEREPMPERWTLPRIARLIRTLFGVVYNPNYLGEPLRKRGYIGAHMTARRARESYSSSLRPVAEQTLATSAA